MQWRVPWILYTQQTSKFTEEAIRLFKASGVDS